MQNQTIPGQIAGANIPMGVFLIREEGTGLVAHVFDSIDAERKSLLEKAVSPDGSRRVQVRTHRAKSLRSAGSLAAIDRQFAGGPIVYDPTAIFRRTSELVRCASGVRAALGRKAGKIYMDTSRRTLYVVLDDNAFDGSGLPFRAQTAEAMAAIEKAVLAWKKDAPGDFSFAVRVGFKAPVGVKLVAVDDKSRPRPGIAALANVAGKVRKTVTAAAFGAVAAGATTAAYADSDPTAAVSTPNFTLIGQGDFGSNQLGDKALAEGGIEGVLPLGHSFGVQVEGGGGTDSYWGGAGHLFWRDPSWGMFGGFYSAESIEHADMQRYGGEAELYLSQITVSARAGGQGGDVANGVFGRIDLGFYATDNFVIRGGFEGSPHMDFGRAGLEFQPSPHSLPGLSLFADGDFGHGSAITVGIKLHFGESGGESLIYRDRHEDPSLAIFNDLPLATARKHYVGSPT
jgi:hypothetical protein